MKRNRLLCLLLVPVLLLLAACGPADAPAADTRSDGTHVVTFSVNGTETKVEVADGETPVYPGETSWETLFPSFHNNR